MLKRIATLIVAALFAMTVMAPAAFATHKGTPHGNQTVVQSCETKGGQQPPGQQPVCQGQGLEQEQETLNRGGNAPPGQQ
jgi:hypothetical protein